MHFSVLTSIRSQKLAFRLPMYPTQGKCFQAACLSYAWEMLSGCLYPTHGKCFQPA
ncbi:MAG: hypothetical protein IJR44_00880 [Neisseriaceae bacterium]|nr:hypothetical protein [Neisseriaceae bacterium]